MRNEKRTDIREKLEALECLPGEAFEKDAAWEKLHRRLQEKPRGKRVIWYWAAAACLLPFIVMLWMLNMKRESTLVQNTTKENKSGTASTTMAQQQDKKMILISSPVSTEKKETVMRSAKNIRHADEKNISQLEKSKPVTMQTNTIANTNIEKTPIAVVNIIPPPDTAGAVKALAVEQKKLRVININELESEAEHAEQFTIKTMHRKSDLKFLFGNSISGDATTVASSPYSGGLKIPLTN